MYRFLKYRTRLILNILVWLFWTNILFNNGDTYTPVADDRAVYIVHIIGYNLIYAFAVYFNTLWLMPRLLFRKKYVLYFGSLLFSILVLAIGISHYREWLLQRFPGSDYSNFSPISLGGSGPNAVTSVYLPSFVALLMMVFAFFIGSLAQKFFEVSRQKETVQKKQLEMELSMLKSQINPHFLFNVLNSIYALSLKKSDQTPEIVLKLADIMRYMLYETKQHTVSLHKEIQVLKDYMDIEQIRMGGNEQVTFAVEGHTESYQIAPALLIPFIENAVKHGTDSMLSAAFIHVTIAIKNNILHFSCINNYKTSHMPKQQGGIGLENVRKRLALIYANHYTLDIKDTNTIFEVHLKLNLNNELLNR